MNGILKFLLLITFLALPIQSYADVETSSRLIYFRSHVDEAKNLLSDRCKDYSSDDVSKHEFLFVRDRECESAITAVQEDKDFKQNGEIIERLTKIHSNLLTLVSTKGDKNGLRYLKFKESFEQSPKDAENFIISCVDDFERVRNNGIECLSAVEVILDKQQKWRDVELKRIKDEEEFDNNYRKYLKANENKVDELMQGKCKKLVSDPWYKYDDKIQDKECNIVLLENDRLERIRRLFDLEKKYKDTSSEKHTINYYRKNISEAENVQKNCQTGLKKGDECDYVEEVLNKKKKDDAIKAAYLEEYKNHPAIIWQSIENCREGVEKDEIKCQTAEDLVREKLLEKKEVGDLRKYIEYYKSNQQEARALIRGECSNFLPDEKVFEIDLRCEGAMKATDESRMLADSKKLLEQLIKIKVNISELINNKKYAQDNRYKQSYSYFGDNPKEAESYVGSCLDIDFTKKNGLACLAAIEMVMARAQKIIDNNSNSQVLEEKYRDHYSKYFEKNPDRLTEVLQGKCREAMLDPWYQYDPEMQELECNVAVEVKKKLDKNNQVQIVATASEKSLEYYINNIDESKRLDLACNKLKNKNKNCEYAAKALQENANSENIKSQYFEQYKKDMAQAWNILGNCNNDNEKNKLKCEAVQNVVKDRMRERKDFGQLKKYIEYYKINREEALSMLRGKCLSFMPNDKTFEVDLKCEAAIKASSESQISKDNHELLAKLQEIKNNISVLINNKNYENDSRYKQAFSDFKNKKKEAEDYVTSCLNMEKAKLNGLACIAAIDILRNFIEKTFVDENAAKALETRYLDNYRNLFANNPEKIQEVLDGRCKELLLDPWYQYDKEIQDMECNIALESKSNRNKKTAPVIVATASEKSFEYYKDNIDEAKKLYIDCKHKKSKDKNCEYADNALKDREIVDKKKAEYRAVYDKDISIAWSDLENCRNGSEKNKIKCETVQEMSKQRIEQKKQNSQLSKYIEYYKLHQEEARSLLRGKCLNFISDDKTFEVDLNCEGAMKALGENRISRDNQELLSQLENIKSNISVMINNKNYQDDKRYKLFYANFNEKKKEAQTYSTSCLDIENAKRNGLACIAAINVVKEGIEQNTQKDDAGKMTEEKYREHYRRYFTKNPNKMSEVLNGKCKELLLDPWYQYDPEVQEIECNVAIEMKKKEVVKKSAVTENTAIDRNMSYYENNIPEAKELDSECRQGIVKDVAHCQYAMMAYKKFDTEEKKRTEYEAFYKTHILAAKYYVKWCKGAMLIFDTRCTIAQDAIKNHVPRKIDEEKKKQYYDNFRAHPMDAKNVLDGKCKEMIADTWYFLDKEMQNEECDAAAEAMMDRF